MFSKRALSSLSSAERQLIRSQWLQSGQCARCFHASRRQRTGNASRSGDGNNSPAIAEQAAPPDAINPPKPQPSRKERSARISNEVSMLQKGPPPSGDATGPGSITGAYHAPPQAPTRSAGFLETPDDFIADSPRMGDNVSGGREGPNAQGVGRPVRYEDRRGAPQDTTMEARGARGSGQVEEPAEGGASVLGGSNPEAAHHQEWITRSGREEADERNATNTTSTSFTTALPRLDHTLSTTKLQADLLNGSRTYTIAGSDSRAFIGTIRNRLASVQLPSTPKTKPTQHRLDVMSESARKTLVNKMIAGQYDIANFLGGDKFKSASVKEVAKMTLLNGSYLQKDADRVVKKVQSLMPAATTTAQKGQRQVAAKA